MEPQVPRLSFDELFDLLALFYACRGTCDRLRTSTLIRDGENILIAAGYNGAPAGSPHCDDPGIGHLLVENHCVRTNHGEENALLNCNDLMRVKNGIATIIGSPCYPCARKVVTKKVKKIRYIGTYDNPLGGNLVEELCRERDVVLEYVDVKQVLGTLQHAFTFLQGPGGPFRNLPKIEISSGNGSKAKACIAIIAESGGGKETVFNIISQEVLGKYTTSIHHFSDPLRESLLAVNAIFKKRSMACELELSRPNQQDISTELRRIFGEELLGNTLEKRALADPADIVVLDGVRRPKDVVMLRKFPNSFLVYVTAPFEKRLERIRNRNDRPGDATKTEEEFRLEQSAEAESMIREIANKADIVFDNSVDVVGGGLSKFEHLRLQVRKFLIEKVGLVL